MYQQIGIAGNVVPAGLVLLLALEPFPVIGLLEPGLFLKVALGSLSGTSYFSFFDCVLFSTIGALPGRQHRLLARLPGMGAAAHLPHDLFAQRRRAAAGPPLPAAAGGGGKGSGAGKRVS